VEVNAGEALYIPPLWFHEVKALESSISVSIWSQSIETAMYDAVVRMGVPFDKSWTKKQMVLAAILYIDQLFTACEEFNDMAAEEKAHEQGHEASFSDLFTSLWNGLIPDSPNEGDSASPSQRGKDLIRRLILSRYVPHIPQSLPPPSRLIPIQISAHPGASGRSHACLAALPIPGRSNKLRCQSYGNVIQVIDLFNGEMLLTTILQRLGRLHSGEVGSHWVREERDLVG